MRRSDRHGIKAGQRLHRSGDNSGGTRQTEPIGNAGPIAQCEVSVVQPDAALNAVVMKFSDRGLQQPDTAVVAVKTDVGTEMLDTLKGAVITQGRQQVEFRAFVEEDLRLVVAEDKGNGFAVLAVRRFADQC